MTAVTTMPATVELVDGTVTLTGWSLTELAPDFYGHSHMQIGGWLPKDEELMVSQGTNHMVRADLPGIADVAQAVNVTVETTRYDADGRFMKIQWRHLSYPATWLDVLRETGKLPAPLAPKPAGPSQVDGLSYRAQQLLAHIQDDPGTRWQTGRAEQVYEDLGYPTRGRRHNARGDLNELAARGLLVPHGPADGRYFLLAQPKDGA
ncbi:hypothetical protein [Streptomyces sp. SID8016]|uniref:hypothetical protein n=1 Tax=Streptomyces sp. SID8016 TaxID=2706098 RepID=UPI0013DBE6DD|nr:hypothetical protein [Streptomyces sp. SID8016]